LTKDSLGSEGENLRYSCRHRHRVVLSRRNEYRHGQDQNSYLLHHGGDDIAIAAAVTVRRRAITLLAALRYPTPYSVLGRATCSTASDHTTTAVRTSGRFLNELTSLQGDTSSSRIATILQVHAHMQAVTACIFSHSRWLILRPSQTMLVCNGERLFQCRCRLSQACLS
jgi:hypothetical protein